MLLNLCEVNFLYFKGVLIYGGETFLTEKDRKNNPNIRFSYPINELWELSFTNCLNNCTNHGICQNGRCICDKGFFGEDCKSKLCKNSYCIIDSDDWSDENCFHCSGHGKGFLLIN